LRRHRTPQPVTTASTVISRQFASTEYQAITERAGSIPISSTPAELRRVIDQTSRRAGTVQEFGLQQE